MTLCEQNMDLNCGMQDARLEVRSGIRHLVRMPSLKQSFSRLCTAAAIVYGQRFKEMLRNQETIQHNQHTAHAHSQLSRQTPK